MPITRRQFIQRSGLATAGALLGPGIFGNPLVKSAMANAIGSRFLVVLFLEGGNDGLNTVTPVTNGGGLLRTAYEGHRDLGGSSGLQLTPTDLQLTGIGADPNTGADLALHPGLSGLKDLYDAGQVAVLQGCGYPDFSLSHEESRGIWETGNPLGASALAGTGWVGRHLAGCFSSSDIPAVNIENFIAGEYFQNTTSVLAIRRLRDFGFPYDEFDEDDIAAKREAFEALHAAASAGDPSVIQLLGDAGNATLVSSESYPPLHNNYEDDRPTFSEAYSDINRGTARDLREVAKIIYGVSNGEPNVNARYFQVTNSGYDTHSNQGGADPDGRHFDLHREVGDSLKVFYDDLADMGVANDVLTLVWSEFSRRIPQNSNGTDHGSQGPMFAIGGGVNGGVYGAHPNIESSALDQDGNTVYTQDANPYRSTDFRDVYGTVLKQWLNMSEFDILTDVLALDSGFDPASYWTAADFDLPFL